MDFAKVDMRFWPQDLRYALRMLLKAPGASAIVVLSLAIGIGANSAVFSVVDALLLRPLPYPQPERLAAVWLHSPGLGIFRDWPSPGQFDDIRKENHSFDEVAISQLRNFALSGPDQPRVIGGIRTSSNLLRILGARPLLGRLLLAEDDQPGKTPVAVLSYGLWQRFFSSDRSILGRTILLNGDPFVVAGVLRPEFHVNTEVMPSEGPMDKIGVYIPLPLSGDFLTRRGDENYNLIVRLKPGVPVAQAQADIDSIASRIREKDKRDRTFGMTVTGLLAQVVGDVRQALLVLLGSVALVLLSACVNVANMLLTRSAAREREVAIRTALGAGWQRLLRQLLTESILLASLGGAAGLLIARVSLVVVRAINPGNIPRLEEIGINGGVLAFTFGVSLVTGILFGLAPALRVIRVDLNTSLKSGGRGGQTGGGLRVSRHGLRGLFVVSEVAFSLVLLIGAGLLLRSFVRLQRFSPGFNAEGVISMRLSVAATGSKYRQDGAWVRFVNEVTDHVAHLPGVTAAGTAEPLPLSGSAGWGQINVEGFHPPAGQELQVDLRTASPDYFRTMQIPLRKGRFFSMHDLQTDPQAAIVDDRFAARFWPNENPIGKHVWFDHPEKPMTVVGVAGTVKQYGLEDPGKIAVYFPGDGDFLVARSASNPAALVGAITREIHAVEPDAVVYDIHTMRDLLYDSLARQRFEAVMLGAFAVFALILAAIGVYGVMSYLVSQGAHDIGIRVALGAQRASIAGMILRQGMELAAFGIVAGLIGAAALTRLMVSLLFGIGATDALTFSAVALGLAVVAALAAYAPARRAMKVDPIVALREE